MTDAPYSYYSMRKKNKVFPVHDAFIFSNKVNLKSKSTVSQTWKFQFAGKLALLILASLCKKSCPSADGVLYFELLASMGNFLPNSGTHIVLC